MLIMLIDHTRDYVTRDVMSVDPLTLATTTPLLYFTRWSTHACAPGFCPHGPFANATVHK